MQATLYEFLQFPFHLMLWLSYCPSPSTVKDPLLLETSTFLGPPQVHPPTSLSLLSFSFRPTQPVRSVRFVFLCLPSSINSPNSNLSWRPPPLPFKWRVGTSPWPSELGLQWTSDPVPVAQQNWIDYRSPDRCVIGCLPVLSPAHGHPAAQMGVATVKLASSPKCHNQVCTLVAGGSRLPRYSIIFLPHGIVWRFLPSEATALPHLRFICFSAPSCCMGPAGPGLSWTRHPAALVRVPFSWCRFFNLYCWVSAPWRTLLETLDAQQWAKWVQVPVLRELLF